MFYFYKPLVIFEATKLIANDHESFTSLVNASPKPFLIVSTRAIPIIYFINKN